ncbi:hypothetical protein T265_07691 [Opisthorchis viverrini]|uniref:Uncharacterized protein n=1 Tax=Opisthorchis viverrini TaxID=6198 RepID=A0A074ZC32_OPIVI|nr:hypothetical protein T265_07691 [Opisthorchis viverrini]KER24688.1 hypothetical protein T265_07691 [Opisthorchis viverrini]
MQSNCAGSLKQPTNASVVLPDFKVLANGLIDRRSYRVVVSMMCRSYQSLRSSLNTFVRSELRMQMRPTCASGKMVTRLPRTSGVQSSNPDTALGYKLPMSSNKSKTRVQCSLLWCGFVRIIKPGQKDDCLPENVNLNYIRFIHTILKFKRFDDFSLI